MGRSGIFSPHIFSLKGFFGIKPSSDSTPTIVRYFSQSELARLVRQGLRHIRDTMCVCVASQWFNLFWRRWLLGVRIFMDYNWDQFIINSIYSYKWCVFSWHIVHALVFVSMKICIRYARRYWWIDKTTQKRSACSAQRGWCQNRGWRLSSMVLGQVQLGFIESRCSLCGGLSWWFSYWRLFVHTYWWGYKRYRGLRWLC